MGVSRISAALISTLALVGAAMAQETRDVSGAWQIARDPQGAERRLEIVIAQSEAGLTGAGEHEACPMCHGYNVYPVTITGSMMESDVSLVVREPHPGGDTLRFNGALSADGATISGRLFDGHDVNSVVLERVRPPAP